MRVPCLEVCGNSTSNCYWVVLIDILVYDVPKARD